MINIVQNYSDLPKENKIDNFNFIDGVGNKIEKSVNLPSIGKLEELKSE